MPADRKPNAFLTTALAATGLLLASVSGRRNSPDRYARAEHRGRHGTAGDERGRGRSADAPSEIPARGWWDILKRTASQVSEDRVMTEAAGITFYTLLALFPALAALISIYGLFADPADITRQIESLSGVIPGGGMQILEDEAKRIASNSNSALGLSLVIGLGVSLWSANQAMKALVDALNVVYDQRESRGFFRYLAVTMAFTIGGILFIILAVAAVVAVPVILNFIGLGSSAAVLLRFARWPLLLVAVALFLALVYRYGPDRQNAKWRWVSWGSAFASIAWLIVSLAFSWYVASFGSYNKTYGSLGAVIGFMTWIWLSATVILVGAEMDAEMEHQTTKDTTTGAPKPIGQRGAKMADTVAS